MKEIVKNSFLYSMLLPKLEVAGWIMAILGFAGKCALYNAGNTALIMGLSTLSLVYFLKASAPIRVHDESPSSPYRADVAQFSPTPTEPSFLVDSLLPKIINIGSSVLLIGILFKLLDWNGAGMMLIVGVGTLLPAVVILALNQRMNQRALVLTVLGGLLMYVSSDTLARQFHRDDPILVEKLIYRNHHPRDRAANEDVRLYLQQKRADRH